MLVGRNRELEHIEELLTAVKAGRGAVAMVEGPAGIGKTALLEAAGSRATESRFLILRATGGRLEQDFPFGVVRQLFALVVGGGRVGEVLEDAASLAAGPLGLVDGSVAPAVGWGDPASAAMHGLYWLTVNLAERAPLLLVLDDAQWADAMSLRFALYLARRVPELSVLVLVAARRGDEHEEAGIIAQLALLSELVRLELAPLSESEVARLVEQRGLRGAEREFVMACHQASGGNPFLLGELVAALAGEGARGSAADAARVAGFAPQSIVRWMLARLRAHGEEVAQLAFAFAVLGAGATLLDAGTLAGLQPRVAALAADALIGANILTAERPYRFVHPVIEAGVYEALAPARRAYAHSRAARLLAEGGAPLPRVAAHLMVAEPARDSWALDVLRSAARAASASGAPGSAVSYLERALRESPPSALCAELLLELAEARLQAGLPGAVGCIREALDLYDDPRRRAEISLTLGRALFSQGEFPAAREAIRDGLVDLAAEDEDLLLEPWAWFVGNAGEWGLPEVAAARLRVLLDRRAPGQTRTERLLLAYLAYVSGTTGERSRAEVSGLIHRALADGALLEDSETDLAPFGAACETLLCVGEPQAAIEQLDIAIATSQRRGSSLAFGWFSSLRGMAHYMQGHLIDSLADLGAADGEYSDEFALWLPATRGYLALCLIERDDLAGAAAALALPGGEERWAAQPSFVSYLYALGRLNTAKGMRKDGLEIMLRCEQRVREMRAPNPAADLPWRAEAALLAAQLGEPERARELLEENVTRARAFGAPHALGVALRASGVIKAGNEGLRLLVEAVSVLDGSRVDLELGRTLTEPGAALRRAGRRRDAREPLRRGLDLADDCGSVALAARAREELIAAGARPRRARVRGMDALTASELRVARLAAGGMTNREIAQALFVTIRTVTTHLGHAYQKLDIGGREELSQALDIEASSPPLVS